jgi:hypothetical protein
MERVSFVCRQGMDGKGMKNEGLEDGLDEEKGARSRVQETSLKQKGHLEVLSSPDANPGCARTPVQYSNSPSQSMTPVS